MRKKIIGAGLFLLLAVSLWTQEVKADPELNWPEVDQWLQETAGNPLLEQWGVTSMTDLIGQLLHGQLELTPRQFLGAFLSALWSEMGNYTALVLQVAALAMLSYLLQNLSSEFAGSTIGEVGFMAVYAGILLLLLNSFRIPLNLTHAATREISYLSTMMIPALAALTAASGRAAGAAVQGSLILSGLSFLLMIFEKVMVTAVAGLGVAEAVNFLSPKTVLSRLTSLGRSLVQKGIRLLCTIFLFIMGATGLVMPAADRLLNKTGTALISAVPVVGDAMSGAMETVLAGTAMVKNGAGAAACILLLCFCLVPMAKMAAIWLIYRLMGALLAPVSDTRVSGLAEALGRHVSLLISILAAGMVIFTAAVGVFVSSSAA